MSESSGEKTEEPTPKKLEDARKKGQVAQSQDINKLFTTSVGFEMFIAIREHMMNTIENMMLQPLARLNDDFVFAASSVAKSVLLNALTLCLPVLAVIIVARFCAAWVQFGFLMSPESAMPKLSKFNPISNAKNLVSPQKLMEFFFNIVKVIVLTCVFYVIVKNSIHQIVLFPTGNLTFSLDGGADILTIILRICLMIFLIIAVVDFMVQKHFFIKQQKMTKDEVFREFKQMEGDPTIKGQRKQLAQELASGDGGAVEQAVPDADAVVVNPTHFAVAISYKPGETPLPMILCKGYDKRAKDIIKVARENNIPIIRYVWLARTLYRRGRAGKFIPRPTLRPMAAVLRAIKEIDENDNDNQIHEIEKFDSFDKNNLP
ncbi:type III secretion system export apparatus subunit SctU [Agarilytica rhodophyticola]|uniref:type III secretion system export apparatus subunit SctU n=1 Tax=Agarilytica rhodophyticola TaxID=1737490 RepID=UPI000B3482D4|nr:type III secretion system export apparatus subunit SctU [Agarilytica rhodophyticola]